MESGEGKITIRFDRTAPGSGAEALCRLENGRVFIEWKFHLVEYSRAQSKKITLPDEAGEYDLMEERSRDGADTYPEFIRLHLTDMRGCPVLECIQLLREEETLQSILQRPEFWKADGDPYLYKVEAVLADEAGNCIDRISMPLPLRCLERRIRDGKEELLLNGDVLEARMVRYTLPETGNAPQRQQNWTKDLGLMRELGVNCILLESPALNPFLQMCDRLGFLVFSTQSDSWEAGSCFGGMEEDRPVPVFRGSKNSFFVPGRNSPTPLFYRYRAEWSKEPFVYLVPESVKRLNSGNYMVCCYSSCSRVALYSDGRVFEFKEGETCFLFREIPCDKPTILLTAEAEGCTHSLSIHKSFTKQSPNYDIYPLE